MNAQMKQRIDEKLEKLSEQRMAEVLDFVEFLAAREYADEVTDGAAYLAGIEQTLNDWSSEADERAYRGLQTIRCGARALFRSAIKRQAKAGLR